MDAALSFDPVRPTRAAWNDRSEAEAVAAACGDGVLRLDGPFADLGQALPLLGPVRAVTRNRAARIETHGVYAPPDRAAGMPGTIGVRMAFEVWRQGYFVHGLAGEDVGLRFYDVAGDPVHEIVVDEGADRRALAQLVDLYAAFDQSPGAHVAVGTRTIRSLDALRRGERVWPVAVETVRAILSDAVHDRLALTVAIGNPGVVQRYVGTLDEIDMRAEGVSLRAPGLEARIDLHGVAESWAVSRPALHGPSIAVELLDASAAVVCSLGSDAGDPSPSARWRAAIEALAPRAASRGG